MNGSVSVLIAQWGHTDLTARSVAAVRRSDYAGEIEILVYDNASPDGPGPVAERPDVTLIRGEENVGFGPAVNAMAEAASGQYILILNNDTVVEPRCIARLVDRMEAADRPGAVAPQYRDFSGRTLEAGSYLGPSGDGWQLFKGMTPPPSLQRMSYRAHYSSAACLLLERELFLAVGPFDELFFPAYYEDTDMLLKLAREGRPTVVEPAAVAFHVEGGTAGSDVASGMKTFQVRHRSLLLSRWKEELALLPDLDFGAAVTHALDGKNRRLLWLAPHLPRPDQEAGHARIISMIEALQADHTVALWAEHCHDADYYGRLLESMGVAWFGVDTAARWELPGGTMQPLRRIEDLLEAVPWDGVIISFPEMAARFIPVVREHRPDIAVLVDNVDLHFLRQERAALLGLDSRAGETKEWELGIYRSADGVITASGLETDILRAELPHLPVHTFAVAARPPSTPAAADGPLLFLGNFNHAPNLDAVNWWVGEIAHHVEVNAHKPVPLRVAGAGSNAYAGAWEAEAGASIQIEGWVADLEAELAAARVFVAPLRFGAGTKGKIAAAISHGLPIVTTEVGAEGVSPEARAALRIGKTAADLAEHVVELMSDADAWRAQHELLLEAAASDWVRQLALTEEFAAFVTRRVEERDDEH